MPDAVWLTTLAFDQRRLRWFVARSCKPIRGIERANHVWAADISVPQEAA